MDDLHLNKNFVLIKAILASTSHCQFFYQLQSLSCELSNLALQSNNGLAVRALDSQSRDPVFKPLGGSKVDSAFHPSDIDKMSTKNFWELVVKSSKLPPRSGSSHETVKHHPTDDSIMSLYT